MELNHAEIIHALLAARSGNLQVNILVSLILDLFMEVEALREALIKIDSSLLEPTVDQTESGSILNLAKSTYQRAYLDAAFEMHNNEGEYGGLDKLLARFYPSSADDLGRTWRECLLLARLGFSSAEIDEYKSVAQAAEMSS